MPACPTENTDVNSIAFKVYILFFSIYFLTNSAFAPTYIDVGHLRMEVARSIVERFDISVPTGLGIQGIDGKEYSWFPIGSVLLSLPFYLAGKLCGVPSEKFVSVMNQLISAGSVTLVFLFCRRLAHSNRSSFLTSFCYGLGTMAWKYSKEPGDHAIETFFILLSVYFAYDFSRNRTVSRLLISALSLGFAIITRSTSVLILPPLLFMATYGIFKSKGFKAGAREALRTIGICSTILIPFLGLCFWYNHARFGNIIESGYGLMATRLGIEYFAGTSMLTGLHGLLASPGKGFFYYSPIAVLFFFSIGSFARKHAITAVAFVAIIIMYILLYAKYKFWHGDFAWGPRYIFVLLPFFVIPIAALFDSPGLRKGIPKLLALLLFLLSFAIQLGSVSVFSYKYLILLQTAQGSNLVEYSGKGSRSIIVPPMETYFDWRRSPVMANFKFMEEMARTTGDGKFAGLSFKAPTFGLSRMDPGMDMYDFWWFQQYVISRNYSWLILGACLIAISLIHALKLYKSVILLEEKGHGINWKQN